MDAHALLSRQGWRGKGHSLHATDDAIGLAKPLLLNRKDNTKGLGQKAHFTSDTWWMNAFDEQLQGLDTSKKGQVTQTVTQGRLNQIEKVSGGKWMLYASFVRGGFLDGTIKGPEEDSGTSTPESEETSGDSEDGGVKLSRGKERGETKEQKRARKAARRARKEAREARRKERALKKAKKSKVVEKADKGQAREESKEERKARRKAKKAKREARKGKTESG
ncbi:hypothetical protein CGMCC3_g2958 [Colletotrichum fructicola]|uniref:DNA-directed RNA polymerase ii subunit rpb1 n=1 Tax=Colletotrichum fructicola (strain Nara gc5) TaxID=1213859 RepID=L2FKB6_COLFN|nr:uncharacterized protein CGMCC3_g2958 [Colletotrichum fructicola]KAF4479835.1 hypothetical protein CGGC5_v012318 [Colletotrichum fructicola Nara gc5]KAE9581002.1 hypothetical protein CGMCC3_g2958 [Colletotrichum fructicola]KAF4422247.1 Uncharacterized protein CFRS1_v000896 [Colletotrichum fructicola]KAF4897935.1 hypothetical protein CGCFRS4_v004705 [Colletotrichum fructicola]KAF4935909.1 hypothetical protein CGCF245_v007208 [Colletotrichum fructicola]